MMKSDQHDDTMSDSAELGPLIDTFEPMRQGQNINLAAGVLLPVIGVLFILAGLLGVLQGGWAIFCGSVGFILVPIGIWGYRTTRRQSHDGYEVYQNGIVITEDGVLNPIAWDDVAVFYSMEFERFSRNKFNFNRDKESSMGVYHFYRLQTTGGQTFKFDDQILRANQLGNIIERETVPRLRPIIQQRFAAGETINFGRIEVNQQGITIPKKSLLPWNNVSVMLVEWERTRLIIEEKDNPVKWGKIDLAHIGNLELFLEIAEDQLPIAVEYGTIPT